MSRSDQDQLFDLLGKQRQTQLKVDRIFKIIVPLTAFLLSVICANLNWQSTLGTFIILTIALYAVSVKRLTLWHWLLVLTVYAGLDNYLSYGGLNFSRLQLQLGCMLVFTLIFGVGRPYIDRWWMKSETH